MSRDAREYQESIATLGLPKADKRTRLPSPQEEEQSQEVQEELKSKFISASAQFSENYITSNFDHLDNPADLKLLVACEEEDSQVATQVQEEVVSQELPEIARPSKREGQSVKSDRYAQADRIEAWRDAQRANTASPPVPSSSNDDIEAGPSAHKQQIDLLQRPVTAKESQLSFRNSVVCFDLEFQREDVEEVRSGIKYAGGGILDFGPSKESIKTAISRSDIIVCKLRGTLLQKAVSKMCLLCEQPG